MATEKPTIIFVPGAWHTPDCFTQVSTLLQQSGYKTELVNLPSKANSDVLVVTHSYGSIPTCEAAKDQPNVTHIFFLSAFIISKGNSLVGAFGGVPLPWFQISEDQLEVNPVTPEQILYNDLSPEVQQGMVAKLKPFSYQCMHTPVTYEAWKHVPSTHLYCTLDQAIPLQIQQMLVEGTAKGVNIATDTVEAGHSPFLSKPEDTAKAIRKAAGESVA